MIEVAGSPEYGYRAYSALALEQYINDFGLNDTEVSLEEWEDLQSVRRVIRRIEEHGRYENWVSSKQTTGKR